MKEIDSFLQQWLTPLLGSCGYRRSGHTYRKQHANGDWAVLSFRARPLGVLGSFVADALWVIAPLFDWFNVANPTLAAKRPTGWWSDWGNPVSPDDDYLWQYQDEIERVRCGQLVAVRVAAINDLFDAFAHDPDLLVGFVRRPATFDDDVLPALGHHLRHSIPFRAAALIRKGPSPELELELGKSDRFPRLRLRRWAENYLQTETDSQPWGP